MGVTTFESVEALDAELARHCHGAAALRLSLGRGLEAMARIDGHHDRGFSSLEGYALERCERGTRWVQESRRLARNLERLPLIRRALISGRLGWSLALVIAKVATPEDEAGWLREAGTCTVREMTERVRAARTDPSSAHDTSAVEEEPLRTLTVTVDREEAWLFECARTLAKHQGNVTQDDVMSALLGEGASTLLARLPRDRITPFMGDDDTARSAQRAWVAQLGHWRDEAERQCEGRIQARSQPPPEEAVAPHADIDFDRMHDPIEIDQALRQLSRDLASRDLVIGQLAEAFWKADGWRRLGYATESQYARERLRVSLSAIEAKRALARRVDVLPQLGEAMAERQIGYEASRLVAGVAAPDTVAAWIERARGRTVRFLREDVEAAEMLARLADDPTPAPPSEEAMKAVAEFERRVLSGDIPSDPQTSGLGRVTLKLRVREGTYSYYRWLESLLVRNCSINLTFLRFLCESFIDSWAHASGANVAYGHIYARDRYRCSNPVCTRRDLTPHHLIFRSQGGDDSDENIVSLCSYCHLDGIHGGRLTATGPASSIEWKLGRTAQMVVRGRQRMRC